MRRNDRRSYASLIAGAIFIGAAIARAQTPGDNVNMVAGTQWPGGDPFLQRQNEPSLAVSSRNPRHLLAGANDYRTVDLPATDVVPGELAGDAWLGIFKSFDGGSRWQSTLLPGYPQDTSIEGLASPLKAYKTAADATVRAGTHGLLYMSGIAFNRGTNLGGVFVTTFFDQNNKENGNVPGKTDPLRYVRTVMVDAGNSGQFLDKPWIAADLPRGAAATCTIPVSPSEAVPAGNLYLVWSRFTGSLSTKIMLSRSLDCGQTWSNPTKLSESNSVNQGTVLAVNPVTGAVYAAWRRFASGSETDAILFSKSTNGGQTFTKAQEIASLIPFDQETGTGSFRTSALPTLAVSVSGSQSFLHVAFSARTAAGGDARIKISTSSNDGTNWSVPTDVDGGAVVDEFGTSFARGHQFMPQMTFSAGKLMLLYYDQRLDHTVGLFEPQEPFSTVVDGKFYKEMRDPRGELPAQPDLVFKPNLDDSGLPLRRHTVDLRVAQAGPGSSPSFTGAAVSRYRFGIRGDGQDKAGFLEQLELNPPNLPLFQQGTVPFFGDYIDIAGQAFLAPATPGGAWRFNTDAAASPVHYATWTSNQDVRAPADGNWTNYTPVGGGGQSVYDPAQTTPPCIPGQAGMRNQNIYLSRITQGLLVTSPQNTKRLSPTLERALVVQVENTTGRDRVFRLAISNLPAGVNASFVSSVSGATCPFPSPLATPCTTLDVGIPARSSIARSVFVKSATVAAQIQVRADEIAAPGATGPLVGGLSGSVLFNPEGTAFDLAPPDGGTDPDVAEVYSPSISSANVSNANVSNSSLANVSNANVSNANVSNANVSNAHVANFDLADANVSNANVSNANVSNANVSNANVSNANISNAPVSDATFTVVNDGNTTHSYHVKLVGQAPAPATALQLIIQKPYATPTGLGCDLVVEPHNALVTSIVNPTVGDPDGLFDPNIPDSSPSNATVVLEPGQSASVTLRGAVEASEMAKIANRVFPRIIAHAGNSTPNEP
ncbi:MAG TPA: pentapeptide repeat-containing protein, partial [Vicinamibacteria bacterium]|nr:pentapeptide repeat-containing protein [Vicinamibacteria bacterium]